MKSHELKPAAGSKRTLKRADRGTDSGLGGNTGKGEKGQNARSGGGVRPGFEDGQMLLYRKLPRRGFTNILAKRCASINVGRLNMFENGAEIAPEVLLGGRIINKAEDGAKTLGDGTLEKSLTAKGYRFSKSAAGKIEAARGKVEVT